MKSLNNIQRMNLNTVENTRKTCARYLRLLQREDESTIDFKKYGLILDFLKEYRQLFKLEGDMNVEKEIRELKQAIQALQGQGRKP